MATTEILTVISLDYILIDISEMIIKLNNLIKSYTLPTSPDLPNEL